MDQMLPSPGFSLSGLGTPMQQLEDESHLIGNNPYYASPNMMSHPTTGLTPAGMGSMNDGNSGVGSSGLNTNIDTDRPSAITTQSLTSGLPSLLSTPGRSSSYEPSYSTPHSMMQPQTPVSRMFGFFLSLRKTIISLHFLWYSTFIAKFDVSNGADDWTPRQRIECASNDGPSYTNDGTRYSRKHFIIIHFKTIEIFPNYCFVKATGKLEIVVIRYGA